MPLQQRQTPGLVETCDAIIDGSCIGGGRQLIASRMHREPGTNHIVEPKKEGGAPGHMKPVALAIASHRGEGLA
jgi:hypothetical protein